MIECKYLLKVKFMGFLVLMIFFCGQRALAGSDRVSLAKLSAQLRWGAENHSTGQQFDGRWQEGILYAVQVVGARIEQCLQSGKISDARVKNEVLAAIDSINKELAQYASRLGITISIVRPRGELPRVDLLNKQGEGAVAGYPVPVPYLLFRLGNGELTEERTVLFNLCPQKLAIGWLQDQLGIE